MAAAVVSFLMARDGKGNGHDCTMETCSLSDSPYNYRPSLVANSVLLSLFSFALACYSVQAICHRKAWAFSIAMVCGCIRYYMRIFIPCDIFSLVLQATGGGMASVASQNNRDPTNGDNIMIAGLSAQVFTMALFITLSAEYGWRVYKRLQAQGSAGLDPTHAKLRNSASFKGFLAALTLATTCIFTRCVFRVAELAGGWKGVLMKNQGLFIGLEGVMVIVAALALVAFHPGLCFKLGYEGDAEKNRSGEDIAE
ncbi:hypothetical protein FGG08_005207 [Glutinoglossum americanum]|uniref:Sphingoid long-chain base transporter RSB1 n=1 Tax=Glutinoglossum americanum TaxID=1670608 RepID=A0A9P8HYP1_9PEZI|nr:hypothetical protein FGG08_005207 [Glutinoglossum americanum]